MATTLRRYCEATPGLAAPSLCLKEVLRSQSTFTLDPREVVKPFDPTKLNVLKSSLPVVDMVPLLDSQARFFADNAGVCIVRPDPPQDPEQYRYYSDPRLRDRDGLLGLILTLARRNLVAFHTHRRAILGVFTGGKRKVFFACYSMAEPATLA